MKKNTWAKQFYVALITLFFIASLHAGIPVWSFTPLTATTVTVAPDQTATIQYRVINNSRKTHTLMMKRIPGVQQVVTSGNCTSPFVLGGSEYCTLTLLVVGSQLTGNIVGGPQVCQTGSSLLCYQPSASNSLFITKGAPTSVTLSASVSSLALSVNDPSLNAALTGTPRKITINNTSSSVTADSVTYTPTPALPAGTTISPASCGNIAPNGTCVLTITPGSTPSAAAGDTMPTPITLSIAGSNTNTLTPQVSILTYGSVYQSGYLFAVDDTTPDTTSIGGKVVTLTNQSSPSSGIIWSSNGSGGTSANVAYDSIPGIYEDSTTPCIGNAEGACNTQVITTYYSPPQTTPAVNLTYYAAGLCKATIDDYSDWYLPAICEMGYDSSPVGTGCGSQGSPLLQNIQSNLVDNSVSGSPSGNYWSSTEDSHAPAQYSFYQHFATSGGSHQLSNDKDNQLGVRCVRALT